MNIHARKRARPCSLLGCTVYLQKQASMEVRTSCSQAPPVCTSWGNRKQTGHLSRTFQFPNPRVLASTLFGQCSCPSQVPPWQPQAQRCIVSKATIHTGRTWKEQEMGPGFWRALREDSDTRKITKEKKGKMSADSGAGGRGSVRGPRVPARPERC